MTESVSESSTAIPSENVCKRKEAERSFGNGALLKFLVESSDDAIICKSLEGTIVSWNAGAQRVYGYTSEEVIGRPISILVPPEIRDEIPEILEKIKRGEHVDRYHTVRMRKDQGRINVSICVSAVKDEDDNIIGASTIARDITEVMKMRRNLKESEEKYRSLVENMHDVVFTIDVNGRVTFASPSAERITGFKPNDIMGKPFLDFFPMANGGHAHSIFAKMLKGEGIRGEQAIIPRRDGTPAYYEVNMYPMFLSGEIVGIQGVARDISERKKWSDELETSRERLRILFEYAPDAYYLNDLKGELLDGNKAAEELTGYSKNELVGKSFLKLKILSRRHALKAAKLLALNAAGKPTGPDEFVLNRKDSCQVSVEIRTYPVKIDGKTVVLGIARDITERRKAEQALEESEEEYRSLVELAPDGIVAVNTEGTITSANRSFLTLVGHDFEEIVGKPFTELKSSRVEDIPKFQDMFKSLMKGESPSPVEFLYVRRDGTSRWAEVHPSLLTKDGNPVGAQVIMRDVTERKNAENLVQESQLKFKQLFMGNPEAAVYIDQNVTVLDINQRFSDLFGYSLADVKGKFLDDFIVPENGRKEATMLSRESREGYIYHETARMNRNGLLIPVAISAAPIILQGQYLGSIVLYADITKRRKAEEKTLETMQKLEVTNEKLRVVGGLTRHDVRNKLAAITGNAYLARKKLPENGVVLDYVKQIEGSVEQTVRILDFAKAYEMLGAEELVYIDVEKTVNEAVSLFPDLRDIKVTNECHGLTVLADSLLRQLFYNLIDNSLKYGKKVSQVRIHFEIEGDRLRLYYEDDGVGIPPEAKKRIFQQGYTTGTGTGYGLYLIKKITEVYGWTIEETGKAGKGARFVMAIPKTSPNVKDNYRILTQ